MSKVDGLLDAMEATILEGKRIPLTGKVVLDEQKLQTQDNGSTV